MLCCVCHTTYSDWTLLVIQKMFTYVDTLVLGLVVYRLLGNTKGRLVIGGGTIGNKTGGDGI